MATEKRLIDANATLAGIEAFMQCYAEKEKALTPFWVKVAIQALDMVRQFIKGMPIVDAVEVVRCKNCLNYEETMGKDSGKPCGYGRCLHTDGLPGIVFDELFCSYGERREGE